MSHRLLIVVLIALLSTHAASGQIDPQRFKIDTSLLKPRQPPASQPSGNVFLIMADGLRWQEVFTGADDRLINKDNGVTDIDRVRQDFWRDTPEARREALTPFLWNRVAKQGQIYGNMFAGSDAHITNTCKVSYPGYSETLCGYPNEAIKDNRKVMNPDTSVFEWLHNRPHGQFKGRIAAFGAWNIFPYIFNTDRCGFPVDDGMGPIKFGKSSPVIDHWNTVRAEVPYRWPGSCFDAMVFRPMLEWVKLNRPRVVFLCLGETDEWAHEGNYEQYLKAAHRVDDYVHELWDTLQTIDGYKGQTSIILTCDHGRGGDNAPGKDGGELKQWRDHNSKVIGAEQIWIAAWGSGIPPLGERKNVEPVTQSQIAATIAALLNEDYNAAEPRAGRPLSDIVANRFVTVLVDSLTFSGGSKYHWQQARVVETIQNDGRWPIGPTIDFAHINTEGDVPDKRSILYLERMDGPPPWWRLVRHESRP